MIRYNSKDEFLAVRSLRKIMNDPEMPKRLRKKAERVLGDKELFKKFVL